MATETAQPASQLLVERLEKLKLEEAQSLSRSGASGAGSAATPGTHSAPSSVADGASDSDDEPSSPAAGVNQSHGTDSLHSSALPRSAALLKVSRGSIDSNSTMDSNCSKGVSPHVSSGCRLEYFQPHDGFGKGCPAPACFEERQETARHIYRKMELRDGELGGSWVWVAAAVCLLLPGWAALVCMVLRCRATCNYARQLSWRKYAGHDCSSSVQTEAGLCLGACCAQSAATRHASGSAASRLTDVSTRRSEGHLLS